MVVRDKKFRGQFLVTIYGYAKDDNEADQFTTELEDELIDIMPWIIEEDNVHTNAPLSTADVEKIKTEMEQIIWREL